MKMRIAVTMLDILNGKPGSQMLCPVALAVQAATGDTKWRVSATFYNQSLRWRRDVSEQVLQFEIDFDNRKEVKPFEFDFEVPFTYWLRCKLREVLA